MANYDRQRAERNFDKNPPNKAPGMDDDGWDNIFDDSSSDNSTSNNSSDLNIDSILNDTNKNTNNMSGVQHQGANLNNNSNQQLLGDAFERATIAGAKGLWQYFKLLITSFKDNKESDWNILGTRICVLSVGVFVVSLVLFLLNITVLPNINSGAELGVGSCLSCMVGLILVGFNRKNPNSLNEDKEDSLNVVLNENKDTVQDVDFTFDFKDSEEDEVEESPYNDSDSFDSAIDSIFSDSNTYEPVVVNTSFDVDNEVNSLPDIPKGQYTRQFLVETFLKILPSVNPNFRNMEVVSEDSDEFFMFEDYLKRSAEQTGIKDDKYEELQLLEVRKNLFIIQLLATRPTGLKEDEIADGIADCYKHDDYGAVIEGRDGVYARADSQVGKLIINIFLCNSVMVSLGDVYREKTDFILDSNNIMPLIWGVNELGQVYCYDGMKDGNGDIIISGESRSGKSWKGQSLIAQMCMFMSPKELELYFFDIKGAASDYAYLSRVLPHCKGFCEDSLKFNDIISNLLEKEKNKRTKLLAGKYTNVKDYNKDHPYEKIPTTYIVIDEIATAVNEMKDRDIEIRKKFDSLLIQIATKYPYLEIKLLLFPHRIVNDIINKTVSSMISTRSVMGNVPAEELKNSLDIKKDFKYSLVKAGDMAIKTKSLNNGNAVYSHSEVLSESEQINHKIFDYIGAVWNKLEPDCNKMLSNKNNLEKGKDNSVFKKDFSYTSNKVDKKDEDDVDESFWDEELKKDYNDIENSSTVNESDDFDFWDNF